MHFQSPAQCVEYIAGRLADGSALWKPAKDAMEFRAIQQSKLFALTPSAWQVIAPLLPIEVFHVVDDSDEPFEFLMVAPKWNDWLDTVFEREPDEAPSADDLIIGGTNSGDWYAFRKNDPLLPDDAQVVFWSHETLTADRKWANIAAFAAHVIAVSDAHPEAT